ncbi:MAG: bifunctional DNA primase/polymerase [Planctomycetaceae bacterium]
MDEANGYLRRKFSIIPLAPAVNGDVKSGKKPTISWKVFQSRKPTQQEIDQWFLRSSHNVGIVTGHISGIAVVDCDDEQAFVGVRKTLPTPDDQFAQDLVPLGSIVTLAHFHSQRSQAARFEPHLGGWRIRCRSSIRVLSFRRPYVKLGDWTSQIAPLQSIMGFPAE